MKYTIQSFRAQFPNEDACLDYLFKQKFLGVESCPHCGKPFNYQRVRFRRSYQCLACSHQVYPTAGTIFHKSTTPLTYWFYAIFLFTTTRNGVAAKELERQLNICYKTALRMAHQIKILMTDRSNKKLLGLVMADECYIGGQIGNKHKKERERLDRSPKNKAMVLGMMEKDGRVLTRVLKVETNESKKIGKIVQGCVDGRSILVTDGAYHYSTITETFAKHVVIDHSKGLYTKGRFTTNNIENYWSTLKRMIKGTHIHVSHKHLPKYVSENSFRYVHRKRKDMFDVLLKRVVATS
ncbi:MAG: IS1595 family transposase [Bacteroidia bacterium]|nr:IS1595 family transposase [Bacteroidia bacterium]